MKDYSLTCACNYQDDNFQSSAEGIRAARKHKKEAGHKGNAPDGSKWVYVDEYDTEAGEYGGGELTGKTWKV